MDAADLFDAVLQILQGEVESGLRLLCEHEGRIEALGYLGFTYLPTRALIGEALSLLGRAEEGLEAITSCLLRTKTATFAWSVPEILRLRGDAFLRTDRPDREHQAEFIYKDASTRSQAQTSLSFQLRAATSLASLYVRQGRFAEASAWLSPVRGLFVEGLQTRDVREADHILLAAENRQQADV